MLNNAGEVSIFRARLDQQVNSIDFNLGRTGTHGHAAEGAAAQASRSRPRRRSCTAIRTTSRAPRDFDPLELDRYSSLQQFSRALAETSSDVASIQGLLETLTREAQNLLTQQARVITELQNSLMRTRMVPFQRHVQRLTRTRAPGGERHRQARRALGQGASGELDRQVLERMLPPFEHMLRNAVVHGIETAGAARRAAASAMSGTIT